MQRLGLVITELKNKNQTSLHEVQRNSRRMSFLRVQNKDFIHNSFWGPILLLWGLGNHFQGSPVMHPSLRKKMHFSPKIACVPHKFSVSSLSLFNSFKLALFSPRLYTKRKQIMQHFTFSAWIILCILHTEVFVLICEPKQIKGLIPPNLKRLCPVKLKKVQSTCQHSCRLPGEM